MAEGILPGPTALVTMVPGGYKAEQGQSSQAPDHYPDGDSGVGISKSDPGKLHRTGIR